ncbi:MAG: ATP-binding protein [Spirochaetes bacterium]|nr:ATP-binding protein [Spirochaetota bacterium]MBN2772450.1 ATP-binding protein [Spirochaetota bacterium]
MIKFDDTCQHEYFLEYDIIYNELHKETMKLFKLIVFILLFTGLHAQEKDLPDNKIYFSIEMLHQYKTIMLIIDPASGSIIEHSLGAKDYYGYSSLIGMNINQINTLSSKQISEEMNRAKTENRNFFEFDHKLANGQIRTVHVNSYPMMISGKTVLVSRIMDVTQTIRNNRIKTAVTVTVIILLLFLFTVSTTLYLTIKRSRARAQKETLEKTRLLEQRTIAENEAKRLLREKELLLKESHHRIKNNILSIESLLELQLRENHSDETGRVLQNTMGRVQSMRILYEKLLSQESYNRNSVKDYVKTLISSIINVFPKGGSISVNLEIEDFLMPAKELFSLGIIINELITNIVKHSFKTNDKGEIRLSIKKDKDYVLLEVEDNGAGFPDDININACQGFGLTIIRMLCEQLNGTFNIDKEKRSLSIIKFHLVNNHEEGNGGNIS